MLKKIQIIPGKQIIFLVLILLVSFYFRTFNLNWDSGFSFHPDERAIVMFTIPLNFPQSLEEFLNPESPLNPDFFAYGNFPLYLLKIAGEVVGLINPLFKEYGGLQLVGRTISALFDTATILLVYFLGAKAFSKTTGIFAAFFYGVSTFPIQLSHFYAVDTLLTFFTTTTLLVLMSLIEKLSIKKIILLGLIFGLALATKVSAVIFFIPILIIFVTVFYRNKWGAKTLLHFAFFVVITTLVFIITQPYALLDFSNFYKQLALQSQMSKDPYIFPYTLQYFDKIPFFYEAKNIFLWGMGPIISFFVVMGLIIFLKKLFITKKIRAKQITIFTTLTIYFLVFGSFAVGWMRYMLPIYPLLAIFAGLSVATLVKTGWIKIVLDSYVKRKIILLIYILLIAIQALSFLNIYTNQNTRIQASIWIEKNIAPGSILAVEHWDDSLPVTNGNRYTHITLPLYEPDTEFKWQSINESLENADYIIIASNRLYAPLLKMTDCKSLPAGRCYRRTAQYYNDLFSEKLNFRKVAEFTQYPTIPFTNIKLVDDNADESFTVYDHPKVMIFKKMNF